MKAYKVKCQNCGRKDFETTDKFDPDKSPNGAMVKCLRPYQIDWLTTSTTKTAEMTCPECLAPLAPGGILNVLVPARDAGVFFFREAITKDSDNIMDAVMPKVGKPVYICEICGKEVSSALALNGHRRSHKEGKSNGYNGL
jgi:hypothetical protein